LRERVGSGGSGGGDGGGDGGGGSGSSGSPSADYLPPCGMWMCPVTCIV